MFSAAPPEKEASRMPPIEASSRGHDVGARRRSTATPASFAARWFWPIAVTDRPKTVRVSTTCMTAAMGRRRREDRDATDDGAREVAEGRRRLDAQAAVQDDGDRQDDEARESVAMIGGIRRRRMSAKLKTPTQDPTASATASPTGSARSPVHHLHRDRAGEDHGAGIVRSTLPGPSVMTSIWPRATSVEAPEDEGRGQQPDVPGRS